MMTGINWRYMIIKTLLFGAYPALSLIALFALRRSRVTGIVQAIWALLIITIPMLGALAFFILKPAENPLSSIIHLSLHGDYHRS